MYYSTMPYVTPAVLKAAPTGIAWNTVPYPNASDADQYAEQVRMCSRATSIIDGYCNQILRATLDTETLIGPGTWRLSVSPSGNGVFLVSRWPVIDALQALVSPTDNVPPNWTLVPAQSLYIAQGFNDPAPGSAGADAYEVEIAPGYVSWGWGRGSTRVQLSYINGWPHTELTQPATVGATTLNVADVTGFVSLAGDGASPTLYDEPYDEQLSITSAQATAPTILPVSNTAVQAGPGTLTLAAPLNYAHDAGTMVTTMPTAIQWATILLASAQALSRGATAVTVQALRGSLKTAGDANSSVRGYLQQAKEILEPYRRII